MEIIIILALILLNGILSMSEIAMVSARKTRLETEAKQGNKSAKTALKLAQEPDRFHDPNRYHLNRNPYRSLLRGDVSQRFCFTPLPDNTPRCPRPGCFQRNHRGHSDLSYLNFRRAGS